MAKSAKRILLVEDNHEIRELLALFIKRLGYQVLEAATGLEAIRASAKLKPDLIITDLGLRELTGDHATARLKVNPSTKNIPVLILTASTSSIDTRRALDAGAAEILHKPSDLLKLPKVLGRYLSTRNRKKRAGK